MDTSKLTKEEEVSLKNWIAHVATAEMAQVQDLMANCNNAFQFAKTYKVYKKDWENTKRQMEEKAKSGVLPPGVSANLNQATLDASDEIMQRKFNLVSEGFQMKFNEPIDNYLGSQGKGLFGLF